MKIWKDENGEGWLKRLFYILCNSVLKTGRVSWKDYSIFTFSVAADNHNNNNRSSRVLSMRFARSTVSQEGAEKNTISTNIQYSPLQVLPEVQTQKVFEGEARNISVTLFPLQRYSILSIGRDEKGMGGRWGGEERQKRQRNEKVHVLFLMSQKLDSWHLVSCQNISHIFYIWFRRRPQATIEPSCREEDFDREERTDDYKRWIR